MDGVCVFIIYWTKALNRTGQSRSIVGAVNIVGGEGRGEGLDEFFLAENVLRFWKHPRACAARALQRRSKIIGSQCGESADFL